MSPFSCVPPPSPVACAAAHACSLVLRWAIASPAQPSTSPVRRQRLVKRKRGTQRSYFVKEPDCEPDPSNGRNSSQLGFPRRPPLIPLPDRSDLFRDPAAARLRPPGSLGSLPATADLARPPRFAKANRSASHNSGSLPSIRFHSQDESLTKIITNHAHTNPNLQSSQILGCKVSDLGIQKHIH